MTIDGLESVMLGIPDATAHSETGIETSLL